MFEEGGLHLFAICMLIYFLTHTFFLVVFWQAQTKEFNFVKGSQCRRDVEVRYNSDL